MDADTLYLITLTVDDGELFSEPDSMEIIILNNTAPTANAGSDVLKYQGTTVTLSGTGVDSTDMRDVYGALTYTWNSMSGIVLSDLTSQNPSFSAPNVNDTTEYLFSLIVNDGEFDSEPDSVMISIAGNQSPIADAGGNNQSVVEGHEYILDGSGSSDSNNDPLNYHWISLDGIILSSTTAEQPRFSAPMVDTTTVYSFSLQVDDGSSLMSEIDTVHITVIANGPPEADAGNDKFYYQGEIVTLNGDYDDDTDMTDIPGFETIYYSWTSLDGMDLSDSNVDAPSFLAPTVEDTVEFRFILIVNDSQFDSPPDTVSIFILGNQAPVADAGSNQKVLEGAVVILDGSGSSDLNNDKLTFKWTAPDEISLTNDTIPNPEFTVPILGSLDYISYVFTLTVSDGILDSLATVTIQGKANAPPVVILDDITADQGTTVALSVNAVDDFSTELMYEWIPPPAFILDDEYAESPTFTAPDRPEDTQYQVILTVGDGDTIAEPDTMTVTILKNKPPLVMAGAKNSSGDVVTDMLEVNQGTMVTLDGTESSDPNNDEINYSWGLWSSTDPEDLNGSWDEGESWVDLLGNGVWDAGEEFTDCNADTTICEGDANWADSLGNGIYDANEPWIDLGNGIYDIGEEWTDHKLVFHAGATAKRPTFTAPDRIDISYYVFYLMVNDGEYNSDPLASEQNPNEAKITIKVLGNKPPIADAGSQKRGLGGNTILLNASGSRDPNNDQLTYNWDALNEAIVLSDPSSKKPYFTLPLSNGEDQTFTFVLTVFDDEGLTSEIDSVVITAVGNYPSAPNPPNVNVTSDHGIVTLTWDKTSEKSLDPFTGYADFEGYRVYRSTDGGESWGSAEDKIYDYSGNFIGWVPLAQFDLTGEQDELRCLYSDRYTDCEETRGESISGFDPLAQRINLGSNNGLYYSFVDSSVVDGIEYTYVVNAYDMGLRTYTTEYFDEDGDGIYRDSTIWAPSNPFHYVNWDSTSQSEIGFPSLESPFGASREDSNFVQVIPGYYASNISFPDPRDVDEFIVPGEHTIGNGNKLYTIVEETNLTDAMFHIEIQAEFMMNDKNGDGIFELLNPDNKVEAVNIFERLATTNPALYIYEITDSTTREPVIWQPEILLNTLSGTQRDSLLDLPGAMLNAESIQLPEYKLDGFRLRYLDDLDYRSNWTDFFDGIRLRFDNSILNIPNPPEAIISNQYSLPDSNLIEIIDLRLEYPNDPKVFYQRPAYSYRIDFSTGVLDTVRKTSKPFACSDRPGIFGFLPFRVTNLTTGKHVPLGVLDNGLDGKADDVNPDPGEKDCTWQAGEEIQFYFDEVTTAFGEDERFGTFDDTLTYPVYTYNLRLDFDLSLYFLLLGSVPDRWEPSRQYLNNEYVVFNAMVYYSSENVPPGLKPTAWYDPNEDDINDNPWKMIYPWNDGDYVIIEPTRWYVDGDSWTADLSKLGKASKVTQSMLEKITVVPNPYLAQSRFESTENPNHRIRFTHLPQECRISIFTMSGELVRVINHFDEYNSNEWWDLANGHGQLISPGLYIYIVETPSGLKHMSKFVVVR